jgi:Putative transposase
MRPETVLALHRKAFAYFGDGKFSEPSPALSVDEFLRSLLLHILPVGFVRIRQFGFRVNW